MAYLHATTTMISKSHSLKEQVAYLPLLRIVDKENHDNRRQNNDYMDQESHHRSTTCSMETNEQQ